MALYQPQLPRPLKPKNIEKWSDINVTTDQISTQDKNLRQYLQNYLTQVYKWISPPKYNVTIVAAPYSISPTGAQNLSFDAFIGVNSVAGGNTITLPVSSPRPAITSAQSNLGSGRVLIIKSLVAGPLVVAAAGGDTIDGAASVTIGLRNDAIRVIDAIVGQWMIW